MGEAAVISGYTRPVVMDDGRGAFGESNRLRTVSADGSVTTLAGAPHVPEVWDGYYGYSVAIRNGRALVGSPRAPLSLSTAERIGTATVDLRVGYQWTERSVIGVPGAKALSRYGTAVAWVGDRLAALGPANGCLWMARDVCGDDTTGRAEASRA